MKAFPASTVEPAKRFTRLMTTDVGANKTSLVKTARTVSYFNLAVNFSVISLILIRLITSKLNAFREDAFLKINNAIFGSCHLEVRAGVK